MGCGCTKVSKTKYLWVPPGESAESDNTILYDTEIQAKAKVLRKGGSYMPLVVGPNGNLVARN